MIPLNLSELLKKIYCLDRATMFWILFVGIGVFLFTRFVWREKCWFRPVLLAGLVIWSYGVAYATILSREPGAAMEFCVLFRSYRQVLAEGNPELLRSNFMNILLFFPGGLLLGALLPDRQPRWARMLTAMLCFGTMSLAIERCQYLWLLGNAEADDILHNTLGAVLGAMCIKPYKEPVFMDKILILTNHSYMLYRFRTELIQALMKDHEVVLSMPFVGHEEDFKAMGLRCIETEVDRRGIDPRRDLKLFAFYRKLLKAEKPDLVITYSIKPNIYGGWACQLAGVPYCANVQGLGTAFQKRGLAQIVTAMYKTALRKAKTVFFENQGNANEFLDRHIIPAKKITVLNGAGINLENYPYVPYPEHDQVRFLFLSRLMVEKGVGELLTAMKRLHNELGDRVALDLVGFYDDDACRAQAEALVSEGIAVFHGFQSEPRPFYANADCVVLASYHEGMSNVLLEAAATGRPVITSDIHGCREAVDEGTTGLLCTVKDADSLYEQMKKMALLSREERVQMGLTGRKKMERQFDKRIVVQNTIDAVFG